MSAITSYVSFISGYIPAAVKDAAGLCPQISEAVRHITWLSVERVFWPPQESVRFLLVLGYTDGFQIWDLQDPAAVREVLSKQDKAVAQARLLPVPLVPTGEAEEAQPLGITAAPMMAYVHRGAPALVRLFSLKLHDDVHLLRLTEPARTLQASRRFFAVGFTRQVELYDAANFQALFSVQCNATAGPTFALGHRWLAYNLPPQQPAAVVGANAAGVLLAGGTRQLPSVVWDGIQYLGQVGQRTLDHMLMPQHEGTEQAPTAAAARGGVVAVRDAASRSVIAQFEDHVEPVEAMAWDPSGLQLVTGAALGHRVLVHRALIGAEHALVMHDSVEGGLALGSVVFQHLFTLSRGYTPAVISDIAVSDDGQLVAVSSAKGTTHVFRLPPLHSAALGHRVETGAVRLTPTQPCASSVPSELGIGLSLGAGNAAPKPLNLSACTRVRLGSVLLQEGLMPKCGFLSPAKPSASSRSSSQPRDACPRMYVATRTGTLALYSLGPGPPPATASTSSASSVGENSLLASAGMAPSSSSSGSSGPGATGPGAGEGGDWQALLTKEVHTCRPFRHFTERRLSPRDLGIALARGHTASAPLTGSPDARASSPGPAGAADAAGSSRCPPLAAWASPQLGPQASPVLGPRASPSLGPCARSPVLAPRSGEAVARHAAPEDAPGGTPGSSEPSKWLSSVEMSTHVPMEVPLWLSPQLSFHSYPANVPRSELNTALRAGQAIPGRRRIVVSRPERPGEGVRYDGGANSPGREERLSRLFGGALGAAVDDVPASTTVAAAPPRGLTAAAAGAASAATAGSSTGRMPAAVAVGPAWGAISEQHLGGFATGGSLEQVDGIGTGLEEVEEDWLKA